jgi:hypothetical protein
MDLKGIFIRLLVQLGRYAPPRNLFGEDDDGARINPGYVTKDGHKVITKWPAKN